MSHTPGPVVSQYKCKKCGWSGEVNGKPRCLPCFRRYVSGWRLRNPEKVKAQKARYDRKAREERSDWYNSRRRKYRKSETNREAWEARVAWLRSGDVTRDQLVGIYKNNNGKCYYCGSAVKARFSPFDPRGFDHVKSRANGGRHTATNIVVCCKTCNEIKG